MPGEKEENDSTRSEIGGIYSIVATIEQLVEEHGMTKGSITIGCDNESALWMTLSPRYRPSPDSAHFDLVSAIRAKIARLPIQFHSHWIKGHQDEKKTRLDQWESINVDMDERANRRRRREEQSKTPIRPTAVEGEMWPIRIEGRKIISRARSAILLHCQKRRADRHWADKRARHNAPASQPKVDGNNLSKVSKQIGIATRVWKLKHATGHCGVAERMKLRNQWPTDKCLDCGEVETAEHVWRCNARNAQWNNALTTIRQHLSKDGTSERMSEAFMTTLAQLRSTGQRTSLPRGLIGRAVKEQRRIGLHRTLLGEISIH